MDSVSNISYEIVTVDCKWSNWSECSASCGFAIQQRTVLKEAQNDGQQCQGKSLRYCRQEACSKSVPSKNFYIKDLLGKDRRRQLSYYVNLIRACKKVLYQLVYIGKKVCMYYLMNFCI